MSDQRYNLRGVSASKEDVHNAIKNIDKGIFPQAFCKIIPDILGGDPEYCNIMHADGAGTKSSLAYMYWKETGDLSVWKGIAQDALIMNIDDLLCVGAVDNILVSSTIGRNKLLIPGEVISAERRQAGAFSHADLCAGSQKTIGCLAPKYPWYGTLLRRRTDQGNALHRKQLPCGQGQYVPRSPTVQDDQGTERYGLGRDVQSVQYGTSPGSLPFS